MAADVNKPDDPDQEPDAAMPSADADGSVAEAAESDGSRAVTLPAEFVQNLSPELLESLPPEFRAYLQQGGNEVITHASFTSMSMMMLGRIVNPIADRVTAQHITDIIGVTSQEANYADRQSEREYSDRKHARNWGAVLVVVIVLALTAIAIILIYQDLLTFLREMAMFIFPALGGVGIGIAIGFRMGIRYANARGRQ